MEITNKKLNELIPYEKNPRSNDQAVKYVANSISNFGFKVPIVIDKENIIVCGHTRYKAAKRLKYKEVPCIIADDLTEEQIKAFRLADNKVAEYAEWDMDLLLEELNGLTDDFDMLDFGFDEIVASMEEKEVIEDDFEPDITKEAVSKIGDIYKLGNHILMVGDSTRQEDVDKLMDGEVADLVVTDPPYNVNVSNSKGMKIQNDNMASSLFKEFLTAAFNNINRNLKPGGAFYVWFANSEHINFETALNDNGLHVRQELVWNKSGFILGRQDYHWKHEPCLYGWKDGAAHYFIDDRTQSTVIEDIPQDFEKMKKADLIKLLNDIYDKGVNTSVIDEAKPQVNDLHPTMKPLKLIGKLVNNSSRENEIVLDLFGGSGSTLMVCEQLNRKCRMMEYDPVYADVIITRWEEFTGEKAIKIS
jgi:site-specific DNA-methyltransferase (adenine-specific)